MAELKTKKTGASVEKFVASIADEPRRNDAKVLVKLLQKITKTEPNMWGAAIVGFGATRLKYESGRELDWFDIGFSPRKAANVLYGVTGYENSAEDLAKLGKFKTGKGCLYIAKLADVDLKVLQVMVERSLKAKSV